MLYVLDENVLINAERDIYPRDRVPELWHWLLHHVRRGDIKTLKLVTENLKRPPTTELPEDPLSVWIREHETEMLIDRPPADVVRRVLTEGYQRPKKSSELARIGNDAFLVAAALVAPHKRTLVTMESPDRRERQGAKRHIPHVCDILGVEWATPFDLIRDLDFRTADWPHNP